MKKILLIGFIVLLGMSVSKQAEARALSERVPYDAVVYNECLGEDMLLSGTLHTVLYSSNDDSNVLAMYVRNPQGIIAEGADSGIICRGTGVTRSVDIREMVDDYPHVSSFVNNYRIICPGPNNDIIMQDIVHMTINANGEITVDIENVKSECVEE